MTVTKALKAGGAGGAAQAPDPRGNGRKPARPADSYSVAEVTEGPFKGKYAVTRGAIVKAIFKTKGAAKRYAQQHAAAQVPSR